MNVYYEGADITKHVVIRECTVRDTSRGRADSLDILFEDAGKWIRWKPEEDQKIAVSHKGYESGTMYVNTVAPDGGKFRIYATSLPCAARKKEYKSYKNRTLRGILRLCALRTGMDSRFYGGTDTPIIPYIEQEYESAAAFLDRLLKLEGAAFKCALGRYVAIDVLWAQEQAATQTIRVRADEPGAVYRRGGNTLRGLTVQTPDLRVTAVDTNAPESHLLVVKCGLPACDALTAGRWARGLLLDINRKCESLMLRTAFNASMNAMTRVDVTGGTDADGHWLVDEATHDLMNETTVTRLYKNLTTVR